MLQVSTNIEKKKRTPIVSVTDIDAKSVMFKIKGKSFHEGYLFLTPEIKALFPYQEELVSITFIDSDNISHSAIYHKTRGYLVCLTFHEWCEKNKVKEGDTIGIELLDIKNKLYSLKLIRDNPTINTSTNEIELVIRTPLQLPIYYNPNNIEVLRKLINNEFSPYSETSLLLKGEQLNLPNANEEIIALKTCFGITPYEHQLNTVKTVIYKMNGRALLADEVGLGKTIEAGLILKEYLLRGLVKKVLILTPASLITQWQQELKTKFDLNFKNHNQIQSWDECDLVIASLDTAKSKKNQKTIQSITYDLLIIDEAHKLKNKKTQNWKFVNSIKTKYLLMLTATPIQNDLLELFNLITILKPGLLSTQQKFKTDFLTNKDKRIPKNPAKLRQLLSEIMVRHRRSDTLIKFPQRFVHTETVTLNPDEATLYEELTNFIRTRYFTLPAQNNPRGINRLTLILLQKLMGSSVYALEKALTKMLNSSYYKDDFDHSLNKLLEMARSTTLSKKAEVLLEILGRINSKVIIFTQFRGTQEFLHNLLSKLGYKISIFNGQLSQKEKDEAIEMFRTKNQILISTESGGEGRNLQFCNVLINYDLPWNPMRVEQRIGRIHRLGQTEDVHIINLSAKDTIESYVLELLDKKINLFRLIIGELEMILGNLNSKKTLEQIIIDIVTMSPNKEAMKRKFETLGNKLEKALKIHQQITKAQEEIFNG